MAMATQILSADGVTYLTTDTTHKATRTSARPMELGANGASFSLSAVSGVMAAGLAANSEIFQMRWSHATFKCIIRKIMISGGGIAAFAAGFGKFEAIIRRAATADGGATAIAMSTNNTNKKRTDFQTSKFGDTSIRIAATAAIAATAGNLDTNAFAGIGFGVTATAGVTLGNVGVALYERDEATAYPILLEQNEMLILRTTVPATGTWTFSVMVEWDEIDASEVTGWA